MTYVMPSTTPLRVCSLFSGIGGFEKGFEAAGHVTVMICEADKAAQLVLRHQFPEVELKSDITALTSLPDCDLLTAGWPCQDLSLAGKTVGSSGEKSGLISHVFRLMKSMRRLPQYVLFENVAFALDLQKGHAIKSVLEELSTLGYRWAYRILNTINFGLPQRRRRVFILASLDFDPAAVLFQNECSLERPLPKSPRMVGFYWTEGTRGLGWSPDAVPPLKGGSGIGIPSPPAIWDKASNTFIAPGIEDAERLQGFSPGWTASAATLPGGERRRWILVGNAVSTPVVEWIAFRMGRPENFQAMSAPNVSKSTGFPKAAMGGFGRTTIPVFLPNEGPSVSTIVSLSDFGLRAPSLLSRRAISGFAGRFKAASLKKDPTFVQALDDYLASNLIA